MPARLALADGLLDGVGVTDRDGPAESLELDFADAVFQTDVSFDGVRFPGPARFTNATFEGLAYFQLAVFSHDVDFTGARFARHAAFDGAKFRLGVGFSETHFDSSVDFDGSLFRTNVDFRNVTVGGDAGFGQTVFQGATFAGCSFATVIVSDAIFLSEARFDDSTFSDSVYVRARVNGGSLWLTNLVFQGPLQATITSDRSVEMNAVECRRYATITARSPILRARDVLFAGGAKLQAAEGDVTLVATGFGRFSVVGGLSERSAGLLSWSESQTLEDIKRFQEAKHGYTIPLPRADDSHAEDPVRARPPVYSQARIVSLEETDVGNVVLANVDLRACRFLFARNLDRIRLEDDVTFPGVPEGWTWRRPWPPRRRWTKRQTLAEEHLRRYLGPSDRTRTEEVRERPSGGEGWYPEVCQPPGWFATEAPDKPPSEAQVAAIYRDLRKSREDRKDEPGAADFYYGEMEMRRIDPRRPVGERGLVALYWLVSGYALRPVRALAALLLTIVVFAALFDLWGFHEPVPLVDGFLFSAESTTSLLRGTGQELTTLGEVLWIVLRLLGPVFFGLTLLSMRGRVKR